MKTDVQMTNNWMQGMQAPNTRQKYVDGINGFNGNPMELAASDASTQLYLQRVQLSVTSGKRAAKLRAVPVGRWKGNAVNIGANLLTSGAQKAKDKVAAHFQKWAPIYQQSSAAAHALPKGGMAAALARVQANMQVLMQAAGTA